MSDADFFRQLDKATDQGQYRARLDLEKKLKQLKSHGEFFDGTQEGPFGGAMFTDPDTGETREYLFITTTNQVAVADWSQPANNPQNGVKTLSSGMIPHDDLRKPAPKEIQEYLKR